MLVEHLLVSRSAAPPLRVALFLDGSSLARPDAIILEHLRRSRFVELALVVRRKLVLRRQQVSGSRLLRAVTERAFRAHLLFDLYERWDERTWRDSSELLARTNVSDQLPEVPVIEVDPVVDCDTERFPDDVLARVRGAQIDVAIRFGFDRLRGEVLRIPRHGVWFIRPSDPEEYIGEPPHFWELAERNPRSGVALEIAVNDGEPRQVLCRGVASTETDRWGGASIVRNRVRPSLLGSTFVIRKLKELHESGLASMERNAAPRLSYRGKRAVYTRPTNAEMVGFLAPRLLLAARQHFLKRPNINRWRVAVRAEGRSASGPGPLEADGFRWIEPPPGHSYADPFLIAHRGQVYCFFEDLDHGSNKARIACAVVAPDGRFQEIRPVLEAPCHLSYPFVFEDGGDVFMIPESSQLGRVDLFRAVEFPSRWEKVRALLEIPGLDATLWHDGSGPYWFFVTVREPEHAGEQLLLFQASSLDGDLVLHPKNPVSSDVRYGRGAGRIITREGRAYRPSQDCSVGYGHQMHFHEIQALTPEDYEERLVGVLAPWGGLDGIHTYDRCGNFEVIDGKHIEAVPGHPFTPLPWTPGAKSGGVG